METKPNIIVLDDDVAFVKYLEAALTKLGATVFSFTDPVEALRFLEVTSCDALIMDVNMPVICGRNVCSILRASSFGRSIPIILISGDPSIEDYTLYFKGVDFMQKPCDIKTLLRKVNMYSTIEKAKESVNSMLEGFKD